MCLICRMGNCDHCRGNLHRPRACQLDVLVLLLRVLLLPVIGRGRKRLALARYSARIWGGQLDVLMPCSNCLLLPMVGRGRKRNNEPKRCFGG